MEGKNHILERAFRAIDEVLGLTTPTMPEPMTAKSECQDRGAARQIFRWMAARCVRRRGVWTAEIFLYRDFTVWSQKYTEPSLARGLFGEILDRSFNREQDGWHGIVLMADVPALGAPTTKATNGTDTSHQRPLKYVM